MSCSSWCSLLCFFFSSVELTKPLHSMLNCAHVHAAEAARLCAFWKTWNAWRVMKKALFVPHLSPFPYINAGVARPNMNIGSLHWTTAGSFDKFPTGSRNGFPAVLMVSGWRHFPRVRLPPSAAAGRSVHTFGVPGKQLDANYLPKLGVLGIKLFTWSKVTNSQRLFREACTKKVFLNLVSKSNYVIHCEDKSMSNFLHAPEHY